MKILMNYSLYLNCIKMPYCKKCGKMFRRKIGERGKLCDTCWFTINRYRNGLLNKKIKLLKNDN